MFTHDLLGIAELFGFDGSTERELVGGFNLSRQVIAAFRLKPLRKCGGLFQCEAAVE